MLRWCCRQTITTTQWHVLRKHLLLISERFLQDIKHIDIFFFLHIGYLFRNLHYLYRLCTLTHCSSMEVWRLIYLETCFSKVGNEFRSAAGHNWWLREISEAFVCVDMSTADLSRIPHDGERLHWRHATPPLLGFRDGERIPYSRKPFKCESEHFPSARTRGLVHSS